MVVPWIGYIIWKNWVIHVLVFLVFHVFSTAELISIAKTVNLAVWAFSSNFLHDFTLFAIDMNYIYHILSIATTFGALSNMTFLGQKCIPILGMRHKTAPRASIVYHFWFLDTLYDDMKELVVICIPMSQRCQDYSTEVTDANGEWYLLLVHKRDYQSNVKMDHTWYLSQIPKAVKKCQIECENW